jgi:predicted alpha-1,6-mannanase (GH76 family)
MVVEVNVSLLYNIDKSTITNAQHMYIGARYASLLSKNGKKDEANTFISNSQKIYSWLKSSGLMSDDVVHDGVGENCAMNKDRHSYHVGMILGGLVYLFEATNDAQYLKDANSLAIKSMSYFNQNGIITDSCENNLVKPCPLDRVGFKGILIRGLGHLYSITDDEQTKNSIEKTLGDSFEAMLKGCDADFFSTNYWESGKLIGKSVHLQINALE